MAQMIPALPADEAPTAEHTVYHWLREGLPDTYRIFHSLPYVYSTKKSGLRDGEIDFVVTHPEKGLLVLEVKGGVEIGRGADGKWYSISHQGERKDIKDPFKQASRNLYRLTGAIEKRGVVARKENLPFVFGYACVFPDARLEESNRPPHVRPEIILDAPLPVDAEAAIERLLASWRGTRPVDREHAPAVMESVIERVLMPEFRLVRPLRVQLQSEAEQFRRLTRRQAEIYNGFLQANRRALIQGYAGTGKTFLALRRAAELGRSGKRTLFLCFNRILAEHLADELAEVPNVEAFTFHGLADAWASRAPGWTFPDEPDQTFWDHGAAELLLAAIEAANIRYDAVLVDEAQDFRESWWVPIEAMLAPEAHLYVFYDPGQNVYSTDLDALIDLPTTVPLRANCRSTRRIHRFAARVAGSEDAVSAEHVGEGKGVELFAFDTREEQLPILEKILRRLKKEHGLSSSEIVLLSPRNYHRSLLAECDYRIAGYTVEPYALDAPPEDALYYESVYGFKGMEAPAVVLFDVLRDHVASSDAALYVGCSRAQSLLYVVHEEGWPHARS